MKPDIDPMDRMILAELQSDGTLSVDQLSERVSLSRNACWRRVKMMEEAGIITGRVALVDAEKLVTVLRWELNPDGSLKGRPEVVSQSGITDSNRPQAALHAERAIRAVQLAAPFDLPEEFYDRWKRIREWRFDRRL